MTHISANRVISNYRFRNDDGSETTATWKAAANTPVTVYVSGDTAIRLRYEFRETAGGGPVGTPGGNLQVRIGSNSFISVTTTSNIVKFYNSSFVTDDEVTTEQLNGPSNFVAGRIDENNSVTTADLQSQDTEYEYVLQIVDADVAEGDNLFFQVTGFDQIFVTPMLTVTKIASGNTYEDSISANVSSSIGVSEELFSVYNETANISSTLSLSSNNDLITPTIYYVSPSGNDSNDGLSQANAWQTISKINASSFNPGDSILFEGSQTFNGNLFPPSSGNSTNYITFGSYGGTSATIHAATGLGLWYNEKPYLKFENLTFTGNNAGSSVGIFIENSNVGGTKTNNLILSNIIVNNFENGGYIAGSASTSGYQNVLMSNCTIHNNLYDGFGFYGSGGAGTQSHANVNVLNSTFYGNGKDGLYLGNVDRGVVNNCIAYNNGFTTAGAVGLWTYDSNLVTIRYSESYGNKTPGGADGGGFDIDGGCSNCVIEFCYSHDNEGAGYLIYAYAGGSAVINSILRNNISVNDGSANSTTVGSCFVSSAGPNIETFIYNNTFYQNHNAPNLYLGSPSTSNVYIINNILENTGSNSLILTEDSYNNPANTKIIQNVYYSPSPNWYWNNSNYSTLDTWRTASGKEIYSAANTGFSSSPELNNPNNYITTNGYNPGSLPYFKLKTDSSAAGTGEDVLTITGQSVSSTDYYGNQYPRIPDSFDIGASSTYLLEQLLTITANTDVSAENSLVSGGGTSFSIVQSAEGTSTSATVNPAFSATPTNGNLIVLAFASDDYNGTPDSGWNQETGMEQQVYHGGYVWWRISDGTNSFQYTIGSATNSSWVLVEIEGAEATPYDTSAGQSVTSGGSSYDTPSITPSTGERVLIAAFGSSHTAQDMSADLTGWANSFTHIISSGPSSGTGTLDSIGVGYRQITGDNSTTYSTSATYPFTTQSRSGMIISFNLTVSQGGTTYDDTIDANTIIDILSSETLDINENISEDVTTNIQSSDTLDINSNNVISTTPNLTTDETLDINEIISENITADITSIEDISSDENTSENITTDITAGDDVSFEQNSLENVSTDITADEDISFEENNIENITTDISSSENLDINENISTDVNVGISSEATSTKEENINIDVLTSLIVDSNLIVSLISTLAVELNLIKSGSITSDGSFDLQQTLNLTETTGLSFNENIVIDLINSIAKQSDISLDNYINLASNLGYSSDSFLEITKTISFITSVSLSKQESLTKNELISLALASGFTNEGAITIERAISLSNFVTLATNNFITFEQAITIAAIASHAIEEIVNITENINLDALPGILSSLGNILIENVIFDINNQLNTSETQDVAESISINTAVETLLSDQINIEESIIVSAISNQLLTQNISSIENININTLSSISSTNSLSANEGLIIGTLISQQVSLDNIYIESVSFDTLVTGDVNEIIDMNDLINISSAQDLSISDDSGFNESISFGISSGYENTTDNIASEIVEFNLDIDLLASKTQNIFDNISFGTTAGLISSKDNEHDLFITFDISAENILSKTHEILESTSINSLMSHENSGGIVFENSANLMISTLKSAISNITFDEEIIVSTNVAQGEQPITTLSELMNLGTEDSVNVAGLLNINEEQLLQLQNEINSSGNIDKYTSIVLSNVLDMMLFEFIGNPNTWFEVISLGTTLSQSVRSIMTITENIIINTKGGLLYPLYEVMQESVSHLLKTNPASVNLIQANKFKFTLHSFRDVHYFCTEANIPGVNIGYQEIGNPLNYINTFSDKMRFEDLVVTFKVDEDLSNYRQIFNWIESIGSPKDFESLKDYLRNKSLTDRYDPGYDIYSDATLITLSNVSVPNINVKFNRVFPVSLSSINFDLKDVNHPTATVVFRIDSFEFET